MGRFGGMMSGWGPGYGVNGFGGGYWWTGLVAMALQALFWIALIAIGVYLFRRSAGYGHRQVHNSALDILNERFARGEITSEEYKRMKQGLLA